MYKKKRGQITAVIVIGILLVFTVAILLYVSRVSYRAQMQPTLELEVGTDKLPSVDAYIRSCMKQETKLAAEEIAKNAGILNTDEFYYYNKTKINFACVMENPYAQFACVNKMVSRQTIESELNEILKKKLDQCIDLSIYTNEYEVKRGEIDVKTSLVKKEIIVNLDYPITLTSATSQQKFDRFTSNIQSSLGKSYELSQDIINSEITNGNFDINNWQFSSGTDIIIQKHRAYPHIIYLLKSDDLEYDFAIQGAESVGEQISQKTIIYGCCINKKDNVWFANSNVADCRDIQGEYNPNIRCDLGPINPLRNEDTCNGQKCKDCQSISKKHGESWCAYDSPVGEGKDFVGSQHIKESCVDGQIIIEECRDYREELCTEIEDNQTTTAQCRQNRWQSCFDCRTKECCQNEGLRDCAWIEEVNKENVKSQCIPQVSPGFRFWEEEGNQVCLKASSNKECNDMSCGSWANDNSIICQKQGDCGREFNVEGKFSNGGFYHTDFSIRLNDEKYDIKKLSEEKNNLLNLPIQVEQKDFYTYDLQAQKQDIPVLLSVWLEFIDSIGKIDTKNKNPRTIKTNNYAFCNLYSAPKGFLDCSRCDDDKRFPCTEYKCKSLGDLCIFDYMDGDPICKEPDIKDVEPPKIEFDETLLPSDFSVVRTTLESYSGFEVYPALMPYTSFTFGIRSNEPVSCKLDFSPKTRYGNIPSFFIGDSSFRQRQNITIRVPPKIIFPQNIKEFLETQTNKSFLDSIGKSRDVYEKFKMQAERNENDPLRYAIDLVDSISESLSSLAPIIIKSVDGGSYYLFVKCTDLAGNENEEGFFIKLNINEMADDKEPIIEEISPKNNGYTSLDYTDATLYISEPSKCRYSKNDATYEEMKNFFECENSPYRISPIKGGTYKCSQNIETTANPSIVYIRCQDNPQIAKDYSLTVVKSDKNNVVFPSNYPNQLLDMVKAMEEEINLTTIALAYELKIYNAQDIANMNIITDDNTCSYDYSISNFDDMRNKMDCLQIENRNLCRAQINVPENESNLYISCANITTDRNTNTKSFVYTLNKASGLKITDKFPKEEINDDNSEMSVTINEDIDENNVECLYSGDPMQGFMRMRKTQANMFNATVSNLEDNKKYAYFVYCQDKLSNKVQDKIEFDVIII